MAKNNSKEELVEELHKPARRNFPRRKVEIRGIDETWQADLVDVVKYANENDGYKYLLTVIDNLSKFAWVVPLKNKTGEEVTKALASIFRQGRIPKKLHVDMGSEFYNSKCEALLKKYHVHLYSTYSHKKASIIERWNRTIKNMTWKKFSLRGSYKWIDIIQDLVTKYNNTKHRTTGMKPVDVNVDNQWEIRSKLQQLPTNVPEPKFQLNDHVRISKFKTIFEKGYTPNWTTEVFTIRKVQRTIPPTYLLKDYRGQNIAGSFYEFELLKSKIPDVYLIEKILKKSKDKVLIKWLGFSDEHNSWESRKNLNL